MMKTMMALLIAMTACGVEQTNDGDERELGIEVARGHDGPATPTTDPAPQACHLTSECAIGVCDLVTKTCVGDDSWRADLDEQRRGDR
jgi:hypothetical protein